ncbi:MAG: FAD:protein FMN transferase [Pseudomonadota bacterium]
MYQPRIAIPPDVSVAAFRRRSPGAGVIGLGGATMGTTWSARIVASRPVAELRAAIEQALDGVIAEMSHWEPASLLSRVNAVPIGDWHSLRADLAYVLDAGLTVARASGGAFDPATGTLVDLWGFGPAGRRTARPTREEIAAVASGCSAVERQGNRVRRTANVRIDLSGIAKGFAVDALARALLALGVRDFLVEIGGELRGEGMKPDAQPWWVDLEPPPGARLTPIRLALHGVSVATSGDYRRFFDADGQRYAHTIDPRTRAPLVNDVASASVIHAECMMADAWATALMVLGADQGMALAEREGLAARIVVRDGAGHREFLSSTLQAMLD